MASWNALDEFCQSKFWDANLTWYTTDPELTDCFQNTVLVWIPCIFLWLFAPIEVITSVKSKNGFIPWTSLNIAKIIITATLALLAIIELGYGNMKNNGPSPVITQAATLELVTYILVIGLLLSGRKHGVQNSAILFVFWFLAFVCGLVTYSSLLKTLHNKYLIKDSVLFTLCMVQYPLVVSMFALAFMIDARPTYRKRYETFHEKQSPEITASFPSKLLFWWTLRIIWKGWKKPITFNDVHDLNYSEKSATVCRKFEKYWDPPCKRRPQVYKFDAEYAETELNGVASADFQNVPKSSNPKEKYSILPAMIKSFWPYFIFSSLVRLVFDLLQFTNPIILRWLIEYASSDEPTWKGYFYVVLLALANTIQYLFGATYYRRVVKLGLRLRSLSMSTIYKKTLRLSNSARRNLTIGVILNAMSVDSDRFPMLMMEINMLWSAPLKIALSLYFLWEVLGASTFAGLAVMLLMMPLNGVLARKIKRLQAKVMLCKDERVKMMSEVLNGIKVLKLYGWEKSFQDKISELRNREVDLLKKMQYLNAFTTSLWQLTPFLVAVVSFTAFVLVDENNVLTATIAFVSLRLFNMLKDPLTDIPDTINYIIVTRVGIKRINLVLNSEELEDYVQDNNADNKNAIDLNNAYFRWDETENAILKNINLKVPKGSLVAIVGQVGCGKSSLISAILGDMDKIRGQVKILGDIAYVPQQAWIQNATLKNNILFEQPFDAVKYNKIVESCTLNVDFNILPANDATEIGEKGINLSGGQKQRVSLARAVYRDSDIYLLDDPLGAVDSHVGKYIFDKVLGPNGILKSKTRILVTHSVTFLPEVDTIYVMKNGEISESGSYQEIISSDGAFKDFLLQHFNDETLKDEDERSVLSYIADHTKSVELSRQVSHLSKASTKSKSSDSLKPEAKRKGKDDGMQLVKAEQEFFGSTSWSVYRHYFATMRVFWCLLIVLGFASQQGFSVGSNFWLIQWSGDSERNFTDPDHETSTRNLRIGIYAALGGAQSLVLMGSFVVLAITALRSSSLMHMSMLSAILRSPMYFFDTTPMGRILNRFAKDVDATDSDLPTSMRRFLTVVSQIIGFIAAIVIEIPSFLYAVLPVTLLYGFAQRLYLATNRQLKRMEANSRSPLYAHFSETLSGASSIRAYSATTRFVLQAERYIDNNTKLRYMMRCTNRWLSVNLDMVGSFILFFAGLFTIVSKGKLSAGSVGFVITNANNLISILFSTVLASSNFENSLVSVERLTEYCNLTPEASWENPDSKPKKSWPEQGKIVFHNYSTRYRKGLELVLKNVSFMINPSEKVGVVGRTGAGKSSMTLAMFRIIEPVTGQIFIDDVDISCLGLFDLRSKLTIIPQDPVLFSGCLKLNLDPFNTCSDEELWSALELSHLKSFVQTLDNGLNYEIAEGGENLSVGQRQLVCLARALLRKTKVLVLDEATASVDLDTDDLIQETIRREFNSCTVITIAHRLNTIMDYDRVIVLDKGTISEFDTPANLLADNTSVFYGMAKDAGLV